MINNNKILTVSYGTFSCTLEGFDDSFDTMKAIAEYFRDLAADDRYFGAEPPQPDAEMMGRIAEREVARRVEVREHEGHIMLKAHENAVADAPSATPISTSAVAATTASARAEQAASADEVVEQPEELTTAENLPAPDEVELKETSVEAVVEGDVVQDRSEYVDEAPEPEMVEEPIVAPDEVSVEPVEETAISEDDAEPEAETSAAPTEEVAQTEHEQGETSTYLEVEDIPEVDTENASVEVDEGKGSPDVLQTEESVATESLEEDMDASEAEDVADAAEDEVEPEIASHEIEQDDEAPVAVERDEEIDENNIASFFADSPSASDGDEEIEEYSEPESFAEAVDIPTAEIVEPVSAAPKVESIADKLERIRAVVSQQSEHADDNEDMQLEENNTAAPFSLSGFEDNAKTEEDSANTLAEVAQDIEDALNADDHLDAQAENQDAEELEADDLDTILDRIESGETLMDDQDDDVLDMSAEEFFDRTDAELDDSDENLFGAQPETIDNDVKNAIGRVVKVNRADLEAALDTGELQDLDHADTNAQSALNDEDEAELQQELEVEKSVKSEEGDQKHAGLESLSKLEGNDDADLSRLMAEADHQMEEPEGATRRSAFAHLRAAVAARFADKSLDKDTSGEEEAQPYRSDLAEVVKPRRPEASAKGTGDARPSPLKLVAEQRIDSEVAPHDGPVAPRRVAAAEEEFESAEGSGFAEFAHEMGATKLPEALEAAAAYLTFVEGQEQFSRPQLMSRVRQAECGNFSREDGLRSFGQLLRTGKIEKIKGGRFTVSEAIGFKPDHRAAG